MSAKISTQFLAPEARRILAGVAAQRNHRDRSRNSFPAPEARRILAGGGARRNHRDRSRNSFPAPEGRQTRLGLSPLRGWEDVFDRVRWFLHRLISGVPPGQRTITEARQLV